MNDNVVNEYELYLNKWSRNNILYNIVMNFIIYIPVVIFTIIFLKLDVFFGSYIVYVTIFFSGVLSTISMLRNKIILIIFRQISHTKYIFLLNLLLSMHYILSFIILYYFIQFKYINVDEATKYAIMTLEIFTVWLAYLPIWFLFAESIKKNGYLRIWMEMEELHRNEFSKRQKWLKRLFGYLEERLKKGNLLVSKDKVLYYINKNLLEGNDINAYLDDIFNWSLTEDYNFSILNIIGKIMPKDEILYVQSIPMWIKIKNLIIKNVKYIILLPLLYLAIKEPELGKLIIENMMSILSIPF